MHVDMQRTFTLNRFRGERIAGVKMKTTVGLVCVLALVVAIGAPPVVENSRRAKAPPEPNDSQGSDDVVRRHAPFD